MNPAFYFVLSCPHCRAYLDVRLFGIFSGLGPPLLTCRKCGGAIESGRGEWADFGIGHRVHFVVTTLVYAVTMGFLGGSGAMIWYHSGLEGRDRFKVSMLDPAFLAGAVGGVVLVGAAQGYRIWRSLRRTVVDEEVPVRASFWSLQINLQIKFISLFLLALLLTLLTRLVAGRSAW